MRLYEELDRILRSGQACLSTDGDGNEYIGEGGVYCSHLSYPASLVLFGGGHVAQALTRIAACCGMSSLVADDRPEVLRKENFPDGTRLVLTDFNEPDDDIWKVDNPYYCIFTHAHTYDSQVLVQCCRHQSSYIGMIGSRRKIEKCFEYARAQGISDEILATVHSPIGLPVNAVTPAEIAVSIMAEIIGVYRKDKKLVVLDPAMVRRIAQEKDAAVCRILACGGSSPAREGAIMLVGKSWQAGTVGGGALEELVKHDALAAHRRRIVHYDLTEQGRTGMACGGDVTVLITPQALS